MSRIVTLVWTVPEVAPEEQDRLVRLIEQPLPVSLRANGLKNDFDIISSMRSYHLEAIAAPTLVISVANDHPVINAAAVHIASKVPGARRLEYPDGGHFWIGRYEQLLADVKAFLIRD
jgi:surfactin synthase thioesterase subunit